MIVYRIEDKHGDGPYLLSSGLMNLHHEYFNDECSEAAWFTTHPSPFNEKHHIKKRAIDYDAIVDYHCGFSSIKQMKQWFDKDAYFIWLNRKGFKLVVYKGPALYGNYQAMIKKKDAVKLRTVSLLNYLGESK